MTDRELLERAAKAAGMETRWERVTSQLRARVPGSGDAFPVWSPLTDDGDALRLAVKLRLTIQRPWMDDERTELREVRVWSCEPDYVHETLVGVDECAAVRRAIVRAAAAMGEL